MDLQRKVTIELTMTVRAWTGVSVLASSQLEQVRVAGLEACDSGDLKGAMATVCALVDLQSFLSQVAAHDEELKQYIADVIEQSENPCGCAECVAAREQKNRPN